MCEAVMSDSEKLLLFAVSAPGKVILHGEHAVVYAKTALAASLNLRTMIRFSNSSDDSKIELDLPCIDLCRKFDVEELSSALLVDQIPLMQGVQQNEFNLENPEAIDFNVLLSKMKAFLAKSEGTLSLTLSQETALLSFFCLVAGMFASINISLQKFRMRVTTDLTIGAGMGSSASYGVCMSATLLHFIRSTCRPGSNNVSKTGFRSLKYWCSDLTTFDEHEKDLISRWAYMSDRIMHGNPSGIDNTICTFGSIIQFRKAKGPGGPKIEMIPDPKILKILLINTGVSRDTARMVANVAAVRGRHMLVVEPILEAIDELTVEAAGILRRMGDTRPSNASVEEDMSYLGELVDMNHFLLQTLGVSHPSLEQVCHLVRAEGLHVKLTGAGGGGYAFMLLPLGPDQTRTDAAKKSLTQCGYTFTEVKLGGVGVLLEQGQGTEGENSDVSGCVLE